MVVAFILLFIPLAGFALFQYFAKKCDAKAMWRSAILIGSLLGVLRAALACTGWYVIERTGGPLQIPAFALAMLSWPEAALFGRHRGLVPPSFYVYLALLLITSSTLMVVGVALAAQAARGWRSGEGFGRNR